MFMKHYAPNRCLYIKVAKLGTGVGSAEMSHLQNCILKIYLKRALGGGGGVGLGGQDGCERRIKVLVKFQKIYIYIFIFFGGGGGGGGGGVGLRGQGGCERRSKVVGWGSGGGGGRGPIRGWGGGGGVAWFGVGG